MGLCPARLGPSEVLFPCRGGLWKTKQNKRIPHMPKKGDFMPELTFEDLFPAALVTQFNLHYSGIPQTSPERRGWNFGLSNSFVCAGQGGLATPARQGTHVLGEALYKYTSVFIGTLGIICNYHDDSLSLCLKLQILTLHNVTGL